MADNTNVQLVTWSNTRARTLADALVAANARIAAYKSDYAAQSISPAAAAAGASNLGDGYVTDGRQPITGNSLINLKAALDQLDVAFNVTAVPGVGATVAAILNGIQVNGSLR